jgi:hypothetical protein
MVDAFVALAANRDNNLAAPRMEWIKDPHFNRQTPGIMTLVRPAPVRATSAWRSVSRRSKPGAASTSPRSPT